MLAGGADNEDAAVISFPAGKALIQTVDFFTPIVNDPYNFGRIAAANALSDVYAMGGEPFSAMNIVCFPVKQMDKGILKQILRGGFDTIREAGAIMAGGHSVEDPEIKYGLAVSGIVDPDRYTENKNLRPGDRLILTKPLGTGVLATAVKGKWAGAEEMEALVTQWAGRLNKAGAEVIRTLGLKAATDVTGFGLGGHLLETARASKMEVHVGANRVPILEQALELAGMGMIPAGSYANKHYCEKYVRVEQGTDPLLVDLIFDAQTSGGLILAVPQEQLEQAVAALKAAGDLSAVVGVVAGPHEQGKLTILSDIDI